MNFFLVAAPLLLIIFLDGLGWGLVFPLINSLIVNPETHFLAASIEAQARSTLFGIIAGTFMLCWFFGATILGDLSDLIGRKRALMICILGSAAGCIVASMAVAVKSIALLITARVVSGLTSGSQPIAQAAIIDMSTTKTKARNIGLVLVALTAGFVLGPVVGGVLSDANLVSWFTFSTPFTAVALLSLLNAFLLQMFFKETFFRRKKLAIRYFQAVRILISAFQNSHLRFLAFIFLIFLMSWANYYTYATYFVFKRYGFDPLHSTFFMAALAVGFAIGAGLLTPFLTRRFLLKTVGIFSLTMASLCTLLMISTDNPQTAWITVVPTAAFAITAYTVLLTLFSNQADPGSQGRAMGIAGAIMPFSFGIVGLLSGLLLHQSENIPFVVCIVGLLLSAFLMIWYHPQKAF